MNSTGWSYSAMSSSGPMSGRCQRYVVIRQSLGEPDPFRLKYRQLLTEAVQFVVRGLRSAYQQGLVEWMQRRIPDDDQRQFLDTVDMELQQLHEGNLARHRLRPSELLAWKAVVSSQVQRSRIYWTQGPARQARRYGGVLALWLIVPHGLCGSPYMTYLLVLSALSTTHLVA